MTYEYKVVPAPARGLKAKGVKTAEDRFANALQTAMNELASDGWEYLRADTLPCEQREGLMGKTTVYQNMLVFRRTKEAVRPIIEPPVSTPRPKTGEERMIEKKLIATPKPASSDAASDETTADGSAKPAAEKRSGPSSEVAAE